MEELPLKHHLPDGLLAAYSAGSLPEAFSLVVATHVSCATNVAQLLPATRRSAARCWKT